MPEITANVVCGVVNGGQYEYTVELLSNGRITDVMTVNADTPQTDDQVFDLAILEIYGPISTASPEDPK